jgi:GAF domain-containing protein
LKAAAYLATDFGRVRDLDDLTQLLGRTAAAMDATGLVVWLGSLDGADLRPVLAHGYSEQMLARIAPVARTDDNAAAAAYRSGALQIVLSKPGSSGAIVAPILVPGGCVGALSAEFRGGETSESVQAFAVIVAAHLATVLTTAPAENIEPKAAQA